MTYHFTFHPHDDITPYELAMILKMHHTAVGSVFPDGIPPEIMRHLKPINEDESTYRGFVFKKPAKDSGFMGWIKGLFGG